MAGGLCSGRIYFAELRDVVEDALELRGERVNFILVETEIGQVRNLLHFFSRNRQLSPPRLDKNPTTETRRTRRRLKLISPCSPRLCGVFLLRHYPLMEFGTQDPKRRILIPKRRLIGLHPSEVTAGFFNIPANLSHQGLFARESLLRAQSKQEFQCHILAVNIPRKIQHVTLDAYR